MSTKPESTSDGCDNNSLQELLGDIEYNVSTINSNKTNLKATLKVIGTKNDNSGLRNKISTWQNNSNKLASETTKHINKLKRDVPKDDKKIRFQIENLEKNFVEAINDYPALQKEILEKQKKHPLIIVDIETPDNDEVDSHGQRRQSHIELDLMLEHDRMLKRDMKMEGIHTDVLDIYSIMKDLGTLVEDGGITIDKVEENVNAVAENVQKGADTIEVTVKQINKSRKRCVIFSVIIIIIVLIIAMYYLI